MKTKADRARNKVTHQRKRARDTARTKVLVAANKFRTARHPEADPLLARHIQQAVCIVRHHKLLPKKTLESAGFNGVRRK